MVRETPAGAGGLVRLALEDVAERLRGVLPRHPQVAGAYIYGSALDVCRPDSDIDVALILEQEPSRPLDDTTDVVVEAALGRYGNHPYHVVTLRSEQVPFSFRVLRTGWLIYERDHARVADFIFRVARQHEDLAPFLASFYRERRRRLAAIP
ncbi:MAG: nucleotidyltransferase domain-containing protein [Thermaerobacter sp.]|jgi:predicted nucleotidyltransferase|nr:nucleotidyltransferase domain-containing protein [Thermaerobacter sp.]